MLRLVLALSLLLGAFPGVRQEVPEPREEHFELYAGEEVLGLAVLRRSERPGGLQLELELVYSGEELQVLATERRSGNRTEFVWREVRPRGGRTLFVERGSDPTRIELREWGGPRCLRLDLRAEAPIEFLPGILERARAGETGRIVRFDPLARALEPLELVSTAATGDFGPASTRTAELRRPDGVPLVTLGFVEGAVETLAWGRAGQRARRIPPEEYLERRAALLAAFQALDSGNALGENGPPQGPRGG